MGFSGRLRWFVQFWVLLLVRIMGGARVQFVTLRKLTGWKFQLCMESERAGLRGVCSFGGRRLHISACRFGG